MDDAGPRGAARGAASENADAPAGSGADGVSRREVLAVGAALGVGTLVGRPRGLSRRSGRLIEAALAGGGHGELADIEHIVILMQENRSFDQYFGTYSGVTGYSDPRVLHQMVDHRRYPVWDQFGYAPGKGADPRGFLQPYHLLVSDPQVDGECTNDITHDWAPQHASWDGGAMTGFVRSHIAANGPAIGPLTMGYYTHADLPFYRALANAFTICDHYFCSVLGPTDPNRLYWISATLDPAGTHGGPVVQTRVTSRAEHYGTLSWRTMPENLLAAGVSWKVYQDPDGFALLDPLPYFKAYTDPSSPDFAALTARAFVPTYPGTFQADVAAGVLPQVSWIIPPIAESEHPGAPPAYGEYLVDEVLRTLVANPAIWERTVFIVTYDENGGFFDHVPPPTAPPGTPGEYLTARTLPAEAEGIRGPIGLGFRVPCLVISPFSTGGLVCSDTFDHTSLLRLIEARFGVPVPNLTPWRRGAVGDLTTAFNFAARPDPTLPALPPTSLTQEDVVRECVLNAILGTEDEGATYPVPPNQMPHQEPGHRRAPSGPVAPARHPR